MSQAILFLYMIAVLGLAITRPTVGVSIYVWLATFYPQAGNTGMLAWPWALIVACILPVSVLISKNGRISFNTPIFWYVVLFYLWTCVTIFHALFPVDALDRWGDVTRSVIAFTLIVGVMSDRRDINTVVWTLVAGAGTIAVGGLLQVALSGGGHVSGLPGSGYTGNNEVARLIGVSGLPFALFLSFHANSRTMRIVCRILFVACIIAILGTSSRGGFVALAATVAYWFAISRWRLRLAVGMGVTVLLLAILMTGKNREDFVDRLQSIETRDTDKSFEGREFAWNYATQLVHERPIFGGGYFAFKGAIIRDKSGPHWKDAHSIYYEALGEHGYVGLGLYLLMLGVAFSRAWVLQRRFSRDPRYYWERDMAIASQMSLIFFMVGGITASITYAECLFFTLAIIATLDKIDRREIASKRDPTGKKACH